MGVQYILLDVLNIRIILDMAKRRSEQRTVPVGFI